MDFLIKNKKVIGLLGCVLIIVGCFLPFSTVADLKISYATGDGIFVIIATIITAILILIKKNKLTLIPTLIATAMFIYTTINILSIDSIFISLGIGFYLILMGIIIIILYPFIKEK